MNFFLFDESHNIIIAQNTWIFFALTVPLTLVVMVSGSWYMSMMASDGGIRTSLLGSKEQSQSRASSVDQNPPEVDFKLPSLEEEMEAGPFQSRLPQPISGVDVHAYFPLPPRV
jgi:hypothetical protein